MVRKANSLKRKSQTNEKIISLKLPRPRLKTKSIAWVQGQWKCHKDASADHLESLLEAAVHSTVDSFKDVALSYGLAVLQSCGGPPQFLQAESAADISQSYKDMAEYVGKLADISYQHQVPDDDYEVFPVHVWSLGLGMEAVSKHLSGEILLSGF